jgi:hypothetical protein
LRILLLAVVAACGPSDPMTIAHTFDPCTLSYTTTATDDQRTSIDQAIAMWNAHVVAGAPAVAIEFEAAAPLDYGFYDDQASTIYVNTSLDGSKRTITLAHELGHAFGLFHVTGYDSVMNPGNETIAPNARDAIAVQALWGVCN